MCDHPFRSANNPERGVPVYPYHRRKHNCRPAPRDACRRSSRAAGALLCLVDRPAAIRIGRRFETAGLLPPKRGAQVLYGDGSFTLRSRIVRCTLSLISGATSAPHACGSESSGYFRCQF